MARQMDSGEAVTRDRLVRSLRYQAHTVEELAAEVGLTANGVRAQLVTLERDGVIDRVGIRHGAGPGKPAQLYAVTARAEAQFSAAYAPALGALVATLGDRLPAAELHAVFGAAGRRIAGALPGGGHDNDAASVARDLLQSLGAAATVHREGGHTTVDGVACPLADAVRRCPDSCEMVRAMLAAATAARVTTRCGHGDAPSCRFGIA